MANLQEVLGHMTGHTSGRPTQLRWQTDFIRVQQSRQNDADAFTHVDVRPTFRFSSRADSNGKHHLTNIHVPVVMNRSQSWYVGGRQTPLLLRHEQGHYNIAFLVARDLCRELLDVEWDDALLSALSESSAAQIINRLRTDGEQISRNSQIELRRLNTLYDGPVEGAKNPDGSIIPNAQDRWDMMFDHAIQRDTSLAILLAIGF